MEWYQLLKVKKTDNLDIVTKAYKKLALQYHPDKKNGDAEYFKKILNSYHERLHYCDYIDNEITFMENDDSILILEYFFNMRLLNNKITFKILKNQCDRFKITPYNVTKESCINCLFARISSVRLKEKLLKLNIIFDYTNSKEDLINKLLFSNRLSLNY